MARFQTIIKSARFVYSPYTATEMQGFGQVLADSIRARIQSGQNIYDQAAAPLKPGLRSPWLPGLQGSTRSETHTRLDLERAHPAVLEGPDRKRKPRHHRAPRRSTSWPEPDGFANCLLQQPPRAPVDIPLRTNSPSSPENADQWLTRRTSRFTLFELPAYVYSEGCSRTFQ